MMCRASSGQPGRIPLLAVLAALLAMLIPAISQAQLNVRWDPLLEPGCGGWAVSGEISPFNSNRMLVGGDILATGLSTDGGWNWQQTSGFVDWDMCDFTWHPSVPTTVWAGADGGPYESLDGGLTWKSMRGANMGTANAMPNVSASTCTVPIQKIIFDPNNNSRMLAFGGTQRGEISFTSGTTCYGAVWQSTDSGANWTKLTTLGVVNGVTGANIQNAAFGGGSSTVVYACSADGAKQIWISADGGTTWTLSNSGLPSAHVMNVVAHPTNPSIAWVSLDGGNGIYKTINGGATWSNSSTGLSLDSSVSIQPFAIAQSNGNVLYCAAHANSTTNSKTYTSTNGGANWTILVNNDTDYSTIIGGTYNPPGEVILFKFLSVDPNVPSHVLGETEGLVLESWNSGATWYDVCSFTANSTTGTKRGRGYSGVCGTICKWNPYKPGQVFPPGFDDSKLNRSSDYLYSFTDSYSGLTTSFDGAFDVGFAPNGIIYVGTGQAKNATDAIAKSINGGTTWTNITRPPSASGENRGIYVSPADSTGNTVYSVIYGISNGIYKTTNGGASWTTLLSGVGNLYSIEADPVNYNTIYVAGDNGVYKSTDGTTFNLMPGSPTTNLLNVVHVDPTNSTNLFAVGFRVGKVCKYNGSTWTQINSQYAARDVAVDPNNDQRLVVCTHGYPGYDTNAATGALGVFISTNGGSSWASYNTGLRMLSEFSVDFNPDHSAQLIMGSDGAGFYVADLGTSTPFSGSAPSVVGVIQAENYDLGGQNCAYYHGTPGNRGGDNYRTDNVDIKAEGTGHAISNMIPGEWLKYSINVPSTGYYDITLHAMSTSAGGQFHVEMNGVNVTGPIVIGNTGGAWQDISVRGVRLIAGNQYMKLYTEARGADVDYISTALGTTGIAITNVASGAAYNIASSALGTTAYIDQSYLVSALTPTLRNIPEIQTAMSDSTTTSASQLTFTLDKPGTVYVALDKALTTIPAFLNGWTLTSESAGINNSTNTTFNVYSQHFAAGSVTLGGNIEAPASGSASMYIVFIKRD